MSFPFQAFSVSGLVDAPMDADNDAFFARVPEPAPRLGGPLHFAGYRLDRHGHTLEHEGVFQHLEPLGFALLCYLIEHRARVVSKRELLEKVWPTSFVTENVVARCVMKVRRALGDQGARPRVIATSHRVGYRFVAILDDQVASSAPLAARAGSAAKSDCRAQFSQSIG